MTSALALIDRFAAQVAPRVLADGQGYERMSRDGVTVELCWYREREQQWTLDLAVDMPAGRVQTPPGTGFERPYGSDEASVQDGLRLALTAQWRAMLGAC